MNLLSSNERPGTGSATHSSMGVPLAPNPLNRSSVSLFESVVRAAVTCTLEPATEFGRVARKPIATTTKDNRITSFSDFMCFPPVIRAGCGPIEERLLFEAGLILEERYLKGTDVRQPGEPTAQGHHAYSSGK